MKLHWWMIPATLSFLWLLFIAFLWLEYSAKYEIYPDTRKTNVIIPVFAVWFIYVMMAWFFGIR